MKRGELWMADLPDPIGSEAGYRRPVIVVQHDEANASRLRSTIVVPITSSLGSHAGQRWTVLLDARRASLPRDSVALLYLLTAVDRSRLEDRLGRLSGDLMQEVDIGLLAALDLAE